MTNNLSNLENNFKESLQNRELPYNEDHWNELEKNLDNVSEGTVSGYGITWSILGSIAVVGILAGVYFNYPSPIETEIKTDLTTDTKNEKEKTSVEVKIDSNDSQLSENLLKTDFLKSAKHLEESDQKIKNNKQKSSVNKSNTANTTFREIDQNKKPNEDNKASLDLTKFSINSRKGCEGMLIQFNLDNPDPKANYLWNFGDGYFSNEANPSHAFNKTGLFDVSISVTSSANGNISSNTIANMVEIEATPNANFESVKEISGVVKFSNKSKEAQKYNWDFGDGTSSTELNPTHFYKEKGEFIIKLVVNNNTGCSDEFTKKITIDKDYNLMATDVFVPSKNEVFMPNALLETNAYKNFDLQVYDAADGIIIFNSKKSSQSWNGKLPSGELAKPGKYPWFVTQRMNDGKTEIYKGIVEIK